MKKDIIISLAALAAVTLCAMGMKQALDSQNGVCITPQKDSREVVYRVYKNGLKSNGAMLWNALVRCDGDKTSHVLLQDLTERKTYVAHQNPDGFSSIYSRGFPSQTPSGMMAYLSSNRLLSGDASAINIFNIGLCRGGKPTRNETTILSIPNMKYPTTRLGWE